jgi:hypothetical protein
MGDSWWINHKWNTLCPEQAAQYHILALYVGDFIQDPALDQLQSEEVKLFELFNEASSISDYVALNDKINY